MELIDKSKIDFCTVETDDFSGNQIIEVVFKEDIEELPTVKAISIEKLKEFRDEIININEMAIIQKLNKLIESEEK
jgi:hypothetical protein